MQNIYPEDVVPYFLDVLIEFFGGNQNKIALEQKLAQLKKKVGQEKVEDLVTYFTVIEDVSNLTSKVFLSSQDVSLTELIPLIPKIIKLITKNTSLKQVLGLNTPTVHWLYNVESVLIDTLPKLTIPFFRDSALHRLIKAAEKNPDSMLLLILGFIQMVQQKDMNSANQSFLKAIEDSSSSMVFGTKRQAHIWAIKTDAFLLTKQINNTDFKRITRLQKSIQWLIDTGNLNSSERRQIIPIVVKSLIISKLLLNSGRSLLSYWQEKEPENLIPTKLLAELEFSAGNYATALKITDHLLVHKPDDQNMLNVKKASIEGLKKTLKTLSPN